MSRIHVEALTEREGGRVVVERPVRRRIVHGNRGVGQTSDELLHVANALHSSYRRTEGRVVPEVQIQPTEFVSTYGLLKSDKTHA